MNELNQDLVFMDGDRTFTCRVEGPRRTHADAWWWFQVSTERHQRHAPFRADPSDTPDAIQARVVAYYDELLAKRAAPAQNRWHRAPAAAAAPAPAVETAQAS